MVQPLECHLDPTTTRTVTRHCRGASFDYPGTLWVMGDNLLHLQHPVAVQGCGGLPQRHLHCHHPSGIHIPPSVVFCALRVRSEICRGAPGSESRTPTQHVRDPCQTQVCNQDPTVGPDQDVLWFHVAVNHPLTVDVIKPRYNGQQIRNKLHFTGLYSVSEVARGQCHADPGRHRFLAVDCERHSMEPNHVPVTIEPPQRAQLPHALGQHRLPVFGFREPVHPGPLQRKVGLGRAHPSADLHLVDGPKGPVAQPGILGAPATVRAFVGSLVRFDQLGEFRARFKRPRHRRKVDRFVGLRGGLLDGRGRWDGEAAVPTADQRPPVGHLRSLDVEHRDVGVDDHRNVHRAVCTRDLIRVAAGIQLELERRQARVVLDRIPERACNPVVRQCRLQHDASTGWVVRVETPQHIRHLPHGGGIDRAPWLQPRHCPSRPILRGVSHPAS
eukprot:m.384435 g.384435  ORF g.384435 m.384435 type:complete len:443 (+) comp16734_c2_seq1:3173-4501(+)